MIGGLLGAKGDTGIGMGLFSSGSPGSVGVGGRDSCVQLHPRKGGSQYQRGGEKARRQGRERGDSGREITRNGGHTCREDWFGVNK